MNRTTMKNYLLPLFALLIVGCGNQRQQQVTTTQAIETGITDSTADRATKETDIEVLQDSTSNITGGESLNDIRFGKWTDKEWFDNDYFRTLRKYIDACYKGEIENETLEPYKSVLKGKFVIMQAEPHIAGGMSIDIAFLDMPNKIFHAWIYSEVNKNSKIVCEYTIQEFRLIDVESPLTKENILTIVKEHPENKLW